LRSFLIKNLRRELKLLGLREKERVNFGERDEPPKKRRDKAKSSKCKKRERVGDSA